MLVREPLVAGTFYPAGEKELREYCATHLKSNNFNKLAKAVMLPHAGYFYSGDTACRVVDRVEISDSIFLIGPNHSGQGPDFSIFPKGEWQTPLGNVSIDSDLAGEMCRSSEDIKEDQTAHLFEHSLEVQLPFLQFKNSRLRIVPMVVGTHDLLAARQVALAAGRVLASWGNETLVVVSSDMSHYENDDATRKKDQYALRAIENLDEEALVTAVRKHRITMCGFVPAYMLLVMKESLGITKATLVDYRTSADASGDRDRVVGYAGFIFE